MEEVNIHLYERTEENHSYLCQDNDYKIWTLEKLRNLTILLYSLTESSFN
jgi:hypothetical protein